MKNIRLVRFVTAKLSVRNELASQLEAKKEELQMNAESSGGDRKKAFLVFSGDLPLPRVEVRLSSGR